MKFKINATEQVIKEIDVEIPAFFKEKYGNDFVAFYSEHKAIKVNKQGDDFAVVTRSKISNFYKYEEIFSWQPITQGEFNTAFNAAMDLIIKSNIPELKAFDETTDFLLVTAESITA